MREKTFHVYMIASRSRTLYIGVTSNLEQRIARHRAGTFDGFTKEYSCTRLVWRQEFVTPQAAIAREKQLKRWRRDKKIALIQETNPHWTDLSEAWGKPIALYREA